MSSILNKFGVYDLIAILLSGTSILTLSILVLNLVYGVTLDEAISVNETLSFLVLSYFLGLTFQEIGSLILKKVIYRGNCLLESAISSKSETHVHLSDEELDSICVKLACGSASTSRTFFPAWARPVPRLTVVVDLPTLPFGLGNVIVGITINTLLSALFNPMNIVKVKLQNKRE